MKKLSLCLYEFPASCYDVENWAERFSDMIKERKLFDENIHYFWLDDRDEIVYCIPTSKIDFNSLSWIKKENFKFNKLIYFGKLEISNFAKIAQMINEIKDKYGVVNE